MATQTPVLPLEQPDPAPAVEHETAPFDPAHPPTFDSLPLLDYRSRGRTLHARHAAPGHYLGLQDRDDERLLPVHEKISHVGRSLAAEIRFEESHVSRRHAILVRYGNHVRILDDRSSGGTFVNGVRVVATDLVDGDVIRLGRVALRYVRIR
jgi:hypothetical protein